MNACNEKKAILLAAYGAGGAEGIRRLGNLEKKVRSLFPESSIRWAFTSPLMRSRFTAAGKKTDSVTKALCRMGFERFTSVTVQSLHIIPGLEYRDLLAELEAARACGAPAEIRVGLPLLGSEDDIKKAAAAIAASAPPERKPDEALLWVGHGTRHSGSLSYSALTEAAQVIDPNIHIGTLSGEQGFAETITPLKKAGIKKVWLMPLLSVIGKHARDDLAGDAPDSCKSLLTEEGMECEAVLRGAIEYDAFVDIWLEHLRDARPIA